MASSKQLIQAAAGAGSETEQYIAVASTGTVTDLKNSLVVWPFSKSEGFGTRQNLPTAPPNRPSTYSQVSWAPSGNAIAFTHFDNPVISVYSFSNGTIGSKYSNPPNYPSASEGQGVAFSNNGDAIVYTTNTSGTKLYGYTWTDASGFGSTRYGVYRDTAMLGVAWPPSDARIAVVQQSPARLISVPWNDPGFGSISVLSEAFTSLYRVNIHPNGNWIVASGFDSTIATKRVIVRAWSDSTGIGTTDYSPSMTSGTQVRAAKFSPDGNAIVFTSNGYPYIHAYPFNSSTGAVGTKFSNPSTAADFRGTEISFNTDGDVVFMGVDNSKLVNAYEFNSSTGFGSKYTNPDVSGLGTGPKCSGMDYIDLG